MMLRDVQNIKTMLYRQKGNICILADKLKKTIKTDIFNGNIRIVKKVLVKGRESRAVIS
jgi:hypothetical protein